MDSASERKSPGSSTVLEFTGDDRKPRKPWRTIKGNLEELQRLGTVRVIPAALKTGNGAQHMVDAYYLNENQAAYVSILSRMRTAATPAPISQAQNPHSFAQRARLW